MTRKLLLSLLFLSFALISRVQATSYDAPGTTFPDPVPSCESFSWYNVKLINKTGQGGGVALQVYLKLAGAEGPDAALDTILYRGIGPINPGDSLETKMYLSNFIVPGWMTFADCRSDFGSLPDCEVSILEEGTFLLNGRSECKNWNWDQDRGYVFIGYNTLDVQYTTEGDQRSITITLADRNCCGDSPDCSPACRLSGPFWKIW